MVEGVSLQTGVCVHMASPELSVNEVRNDSACKHADISYTHPLYASIWDAFIVLRW